ncbi:MAG: biotin/lipoyl-containing protein, partial [Nannocystaceae bacterium]
LEMNTRLQVEHPVTEMVTGFDLVAWQLAIAEGEPLPVDQSQIYPKGHAIEARLYAEDPYAGYLPQSGPVDYWQPPCGPGLRVDHGVCAGQPVTPHYDPMVAKVIAHGDTREQARRRLCRALEQTILLGTTTNRSFLQAVLQHPSFAGGEATTSFLTTAAADLVDKAPTPPPQAWAVAALVHTLGDAKTLDGWRSSAPLAGPLDLTCGEQRATLARTVHPGSLEVANLPGADTSIVVTPLVREGARLRVCLGGVQQTVYTHRDGDGRLHLHFAEATFVFAQFHHGAAAVANDGVVRAPTGGRVIAVHVEAGATVEQGQPLVVLEAMKIETTLVAPVDGTVVTVAVKQGGQVRQRAVLLELKPNEAST